MAFINIEIKARTAQPELIRQVLLKHKAEFRGNDHQTDTYFRVSNGRLKLRQGNIENSLIFYERKNQAGPKQSDFNLVPVSDSDRLKEILSGALGVKVVVKKQREIYYIQNVKFHIDTLEELGHFVEIEAGNKTHDLPAAKLHEQCRFYMNEFNILDEDLINVSYSDLMMEKAETVNA